MISRLQICHDKSETSMNVYVYAYECNVTRIFENRWALNSDKTESQCILCYLFSNVILNFAQTDGFIVDFMVEFQSNEH